MLKNLKSWKRFLINKVSNLSLKNIKVSKTSFSVRTFILSLVCLTLVFSVMLIEGQIPFLSKAAEPDPTLLAQYEADSDFLGFFSYNGNDRYYFKTGVVKDSTGTNVTGIGFRIDTVTNNSSDGHIYNFSDGLSIYEGTFNGTSSTISTPHGSTSEGLASTLNVKKIVASRNKAYLSGYLTDWLSGLTKLEYFDGTNFDTSAVTKMNKAFYSLSNLKYCDVSSFDTSNVTTMEEMFQDCSSLISLDLSSFDTSKCTSMKRMLYRCSNLETLDVSSFDTSNVTDLSTFLCGCAKLKDIDVSNFDTSKVENIDNFFNGCSTLKNIDISNFDLATATSLKSFFRGCSKLETIDLSSLNVSGIENIQYLFYGCSNLKYVDLSTWDISNVTEYENAFIGANSQMLLKTPAVVPASLENKITIPSLKDKSGNEFTKLPVTTGTSMALYKDNTKKLLYMDDDYNYFADGTVTDYSDVTVSSITLEHAPFDLSGGENDINGYLFSNGLYIIDGEGIIVNLDDATDEYAPMAKLITSEYANKIKKIVASYEGFIINDDVFLYNFFQDLINLEEFDSARMDFSNVTSIWYLFKNSFSKDKDTYADLSYLDLSNCTQISGLFIDANCKKVNFSNNKFNPSGTTFYGLFMSNTGTNNIEEVDLSNIVNGNKISDLSFLFMSAYDIQKINFSGTDLGEASADVPYIFPFTINKTLEIILPKSCPSNIEIYGGEDFKGYDIYGNEVGSSYTYLPAFGDTNSNGKADAGELYMIKHEVPVNETIYTSTDGSGLIYYKNGTSDLSITNASFDSDNDGILDTDCVWDISKANDGSIMCYIYTDGTMIFDGNGPIKGSGDGYTNDLSIPWRMTYKDSEGNDFIPLNNVKKIVFSDNKFIPTGKLDFYFSPNQETNTVLEEIDFTNIDTRNVTSFKSLLKGQNISKLTNIDKLNTSSATTFDGMFYKVGNSQYKLDVNLSYDATNNYWDVSKSSDFKNMFQYCYFNSLNLSGWKLNSTESNGSIPFASFVNGAHIKSIDVSDWINSNKANPDQMFRFLYDCHELDLSDFVFGKASSNMFNRRSGLETIILPDNAVGFDISLIDTEWDSNRVHNYYAYNSEGERTSYSPLDNLIGKTSNAYMIKLLDDTLYTDPVTNITYYRSGTTSDPNVKILEYTPSASDSSRTDNKCIWGFGKVNRDALKAYIFDDGLMIFDGSGETNFSGYAGPWAFGYNYNEGPFITVKEIVASNDGFKPEGNCSKLFAANCTSNVSHTILENIDLTRMDFSKATNLSALFKQNHNLKQIKGLNTINTSSCTAMNDMFAFCTSLEEVNLSSFNTSKVTDMSYMFDHCKSLTELDVSSFDTRLVTNFRNMFSCCEKVQDFDISNFKGQPTQVVQMFSGCISTRDIIFPSDLSKFTGTDKSLITSFDLSKLTNIAGFYQESNSSNKNGYWDFSIFKNTDAPITSMTFAGRLLKGKVNLEGVDLSGLTQIGLQSYAFGDANISEFILPKDVPHDANKFIDLPLGANNMWQGFDINGNPIDYCVLDRKLPKAKPGANGTFEAGELYKIIQVEDVLYIDNEGEEDEVVYKATGAFNKSGEKVANKVKDYDIHLNNGENYSLDRSVYAYIYDDGTMVFKGIGDIKSVGNGYADANSIPWRADKNVEKIKRVVGSNYGFIPYGSMESYFDMSEYLGYDGLDTTIFEEIDFTNIDTSNVTSFKNMFRHAKNLTTLKEVNNLDTDNVLDMSGMFYNCSKISLLDIHHDSSRSNVWNVSDVSSFDSMFYHMGDGISGTDLNISGWTFDESDINCQNMFESANLKTFNANNITNTDHILKWNGMFNKTKFKCVLDLTNFSFTNNNAGNSYADAISISTNNNAMQNIILPESGNIRSGLNLLLPSKVDCVWFGYDSSGNKIDNTVYTTLPAKGDKANLYQIKMEERLLHTDREGIKYYPSKTNKAEITLAKYDHDNNPSTAEVDCVWNLSTDGKVKAYLYSDGTLILDGEGELDAVTSNGALDDEYCHMIYPWRRYHKLTSIKRIYGSNYKFIPHGSIESLFDFRADGDKGAVGAFYDEHTNEHCIADTYGEIQVNTIDVSNFDLKHVTSAKDMFRCLKTKYMTDIYLEGLDLSSCTDLSGMFCGMMTASNSYYKMHLKDWILNPSNGVNMNDFFGATSTDLIDISGWRNTENIFNISKFFNASYTHIYFSGVLDLSPLKLTNTNLRTSSNTDKFLSGFIRGPKKIILPQEIDSNVNIDLNSLANNSWFGYKQDGTKLDNTIYTKLVPRGYVPGLYELRLEPSDLFEIDGIKYMASDLLYKWDVSEKGDEGNIFAYAFKDADNNVTVIFNDESTSGTHYLMDFYTFMKDKTDTTYISELNSQSLDDVLKIEAYRIHSVTPWSILNMVSEDYKVTSFKFNNAIHVKNSDCLFSGTNANKIEIGSNLVFELSDSSNHYDHQGMFKYISQPMTVKFTSDIPWLQFDFSTTNYGISAEGDLNTIDFRGITITNSEEQWYGVLEKDRLFKIDNTIGKIYLPEHLVGFDTDTYKSRLNFGDNTVINLYEAYNDNNTPLLENDDIFLGYTWYLMDTHSEIFKDNDGNTVYPTYLKHVTHEDAFYLGYLEIFNRYVDGTYLSLDDRIDDARSASPSIVSWLDFYFGTYQGQEISCDIQENWEWYDLTGPLKKLFDDSSFNGSFKSNDLRMEYSYYYGGRPYDASIDLMNLTYDLFEYIKEERVKDGLPNKINYISYQNKYTYDNDTNELGYFKKKCNEFIKENFDKELSNIGTPSTYGDEVKLYVSNALGDIYDIFYNVDDETDTDGKLKFVKSTIEPVLDTTLNSYVFKFDLLSAGKFTFKALSKYFTNFNEKPTKLDDDSDNAYTKVFNTNMIDLSDTNTNVTVSAVTPQLLAEPPVQIKPSITVSFENNEGVIKELELDSDYTVSYGDNDVAGEDAGSITITGNSTTTTGTRTINFTIKNSFIKLKLSDMTLSDEEKNIVRYKDGTRNAAQDVTTFNDASNTLHPYIVYNDGTTDHKIYLAYTNAYVSEKTSPYNPVYKAADGPNITGFHPRRNIYFEGLGILNASDQLAYRLYEDDLTTSIDPSSGNNKYLLQGATLLWDDVNPKVQSLTSDKTKYGKGKEITLYLVLSEELNTSNFVSKYVDTNKVYISYKLGTYQGKAYLKDFEFENALGEAKTKLIFKGTVPDILEEGTFSFQDFELVNEAAPLTDYANNELAASFAKNTWETFFQDVEVNTRGFIIPITVTNASEEPLTNKQFTESEKIFFDIDLSGIDLDPAKAYTKDSILEKFKLAITNNIDGKTENDKNLTLKDISNDDGTLYPFASITESASKFKVTVNLNKLDLLNNSFIQKDDTKGYNVKIEIEAGSLETATQKNVKVSSEVNIKKVMTTGNIIVKLQRPDREDKVLHFDKNKNQLVDDAGVKVKFQNGDKIVIEGDPDTKIAYKKGGSDFVETAKLEIPITLSCDDVKYEDITTYKNGIAANKDDIFTISINLVKLIIIKEGEGGVVTPLGTFDIDKASKEINVTVDSDYKAEIYEGNTLVKTLTETGKHLIDNLKDLFNDLQVKVKFISNKKPDPVTPSGGGGGGGVSITIGTKPLDEEGKVIEITKAYMKGYGDGSFKPKGYVTREEVATIVARLNTEFDEMSNFSMYNDFEDSYRRWSNNYLGFCRYKGLINGYEDGSFKPTSTMTRAELATLVNNFLRVKNANFDNVDLSKAAFSDVEGRWFEESVNKLAHLGILNGYEDGTFRGDNPVTRVEVAIVMNKINGRNTNIDIPKEYQDKVDAMFKDVKKGTWYFNDICQAAIDHPSNLY